MKLLVVSDSHFDRTALSNLLEEIRRRGDIDAVAHLGDMQSDAVWLRAQLDIPVYSVPGNCDMEPNAPAELVIPQSPLLTMVMQDTAESSVSPTTKESILKFLLEKSPATLERTPERFSTRTE